MSLRCTWTPDSRHIFWLVQIYLVRILGELSDLTNKNTGCSTKFVSQIHSESFLKGAAAAAKSLQSCPTLCDPMDGSPPGSAVPGILQTRTLELVAISFSSAWKWKVKVKSLSRVWLPATPWTAAHQAPPSMGFFQARVLEGAALPSPLKGEYIPNTSWDILTLNMYSLLIWNAKVTGNLCFIWQLLFQEIGFLNSKALISCCASTKPSYSPGWTSNVAESLTAELIQN